MNTPNPVDLLFADIDKLSPGDDSLSLYVLRSLPEHRFDVVVDAGCATLLPRHPVKGPRLKHPCRQLHAPDAEGIIDVLPWTRRKAVHRYGERGSSYFSHLLRSQ